MNSRFGVSVPRCGVAVLLAAGLLAACQRASEGSPSAGSLQRAHVQSMTVECSQVTDGQRSWLELSVDVDGEPPLRMPVIFKQGGRPVELPDGKARELLGEWLKARAQEVAIFGTIGLSFGQTSPAVTIDVDHRPGFGS